MDSNGRQQNGDKWQDKCQIIVHICIEKTSSCNTENIDKLCTESQYLCHLKRNIYNNMEGSDSSNICFNLL